MRACSEQFGRARLHRAIGYDPKRHKAADKEECRFFSHARAIGQCCVEIQRDADHEPRIARTKQKHARRRQTVDARILREHLAEFRVFRTFRQPLRHKHNDRHQDHHQYRGHAQNGSCEPKHREKRRPQKEAEPFHSILGAGQKRNPAKQPPVF